MALLEAVRLLRRALWVILVVALMGVSFSGVLTFREFTGGPAACSAIGKPGTILGYPPCVYGLVMYGIVASVAAWALGRSRRTRVDQEV